MRILVLSFYFRPDLCAGSFRATALVSALKTAAPPGSCIDVLTTLPNRYSSFSADAPQAEMDGNVSIRRFAITAHKSGMVDQAMASLAFSRQALKRVGSSDYDIVFATSSRLMTAALGAWIARRKHARLYLDIRDIFVDTIKDVFPGCLAWVARSVFSVLERWAIDRADKVNLVSGGFSEYFVKRYPLQRFSYFTNGIDDEFLSAVPAGPVVSGRPCPVQVVCAGNIGEGQGLHLIIPELAKRMRGRVHFKVIGDGGRKEALRKALADAGADNVELLPPVQRSRLVVIYQEADVFFLHLNDYDAFKKVLPSKLFEYAAMGKPIWAGLCGYSADFVRVEIGNAAVFDPCDADGAERVFGDLVLQCKPRTKFVRKFARANICRQMAEDIVAVVGRR